MVFTKGSQGSASELHALPRVGLSARSQAVRSDASCLSAPQPTVRLCWLVVWEWSGRLLRAVRSAREKPARPLHMLSRGRPMMRETTGDFGTVVVQQLRSLGDGL